MIFSYSNKTPNSCCSYFTGSANNLLFDYCCCLMETEYYPRSSSCLVFMCVCVRSRRVELIKLMVQYIRFVGLCLRKKKFGVKFQYAHAYGMMPHPVYCLLKLKQSAISTEVTASLRLTPTYNLRCD